MNNTFCLFINNSCNSRCVFARSARIGYGITLGCLLADKLACAHPDDFKALGEYIIDRQRRNH